MSQHKRARKERRREARSVERAKAKLGIKARVEAVRVALRDPGFDVAVNDALRWEHAIEPHRHVDQVRDAALGVLRARGIDVDGINLKIKWREAEGRKLDIEACLTMEMAQQAQAAAQLRRVRVEG